MRVVGAVAVGWKRNDPCLFPRSLVSFGRSVIDALLESIYSRSMTGTAGACIEIFPNEVGKL